MLQITAKAKYLGRPKAQQANYNYDHQQKSTEIGEVQEKRLIFQDSNQSYGKVCSTTSPFVRVVTTVRNDSDQLDRKGFVATPSLSPHNGDRASGSGKYFYYNVETRTGENNPVSFSGKTEKKKKPFLHGSNSILLPLRDSGRSGVCVWEREIDLGKADAFASKRKTVDYLLDNHNVTWRSQKLLVSLQVSLSKGVPDFEIELRPVGERRNPVSSLKVKIPAFEKRSLRSENAPESVGKCVQKKFRFNGFTSKSDGEFFFGNTSVFSIGGMAYPSLVGNHNRICSVQVEAPSDKRFSLVLSILHVTATQKTIKGKSTF